MNKGERYTVIGHIELHTKFNQSADFIKIGIFVKETKHNYYFDTFYVKKRTVRKIYRGDILAISASLLEKSYE